MNTLYLMCGLAFSGKSTLAQTMVEQLGCAYVSLDAINAERGLWGGDGIPVTEWKRTHQIARARIGALMRTGQDIVLDDTNNLRGLRERWRLLAQEHGYQTRVIYLDVPLEQLTARRQANRDSATRQDVTDTVWIEHVASFEPPEADEDVVRFSPGLDLCTWLQALTDEPTNKT